MKTNSFIILAAILLTTACKNDALIRPGEPVNTAYDKSMALFEKGKYGDAANAFETVTRMGRGTNYAKDAQYYLAESYFKGERFLLAAAEYERFISYFPQDTKREEVDYKRALSYFKQSPRYRLDQDPTRRAIQLFQLFNNSYPDSDLVTEAAEKIDILRAKLAHKYYESANFYARTDSYRAASIYYDLTIDQFPETKWAEMSVVEQINNFNNYAARSVDAKQQERYQSALDSYDKFLQLFPRSELRATAERYRDVAEINIKRIISETKSSESELVGAN